MTTSDPRIQGNGATVAIVATVLNERASIGELLDSFLNQSRRPDEIIVVDGGSQDGTQEILRSYAYRHRALKFFVDPGVNIARGRNLAILRSSCDIMVVTDGGCRPEPTWIEHLIQPLLDDPGIGAVAGLTRIAGRNRFENFAGLMSTSVNASDEASRVFHGRNSAFRRAVWLQAGGYPEWLYTAEDTLFCQRAKATGCRVGLAESAVVSWRPRPTLGKLAKQYFLYGRGTGRIGRSDPHALLYHLRNHALLWGSLLLAPFWPWTLVVTCIMAVQVHRLLVAPALVAVRARTKDPAAAYLVPLLVLTRSLTNSMGQVYGLWEYRRVPPFRQNVALYTAGEWKMAELR